jgi:multidrug efflux pump subunit AcrA (membrane-fusion protein)
MPNPPHDERSGQRQLESHEPPLSQRLGDGRENLGDAFADPNSLDDAKLGHSFELSNSSAKKHHRPIKQVVAAPFEKPQSRRIIYWVIAGMVAAMAIALVVGILPRLKTKHETDKLSEQQKSKDAKPEIVVMRVSREKDGSGLVVPGTTTALQEAAVYARANGYLKRRYVDIGDHVRQGQLLAIIDAPDLDQQVEQARQQVSQSEAQLEQQKAQLALNKITNERYQALVARGVLSRQDGDQQMTNFNAQVANVASAERNVEAFKANLGHVLALQSYERVTAPFDGVVTQRNVDTGDLISAAGASGGNAPSTLATSQGTSGSASGASNSSGSSGTASTLATPSTGSGTGGALFTIAQSGRLRIYVSVPESYSSLVHIGQRATLSFQEFPDQTFFGDVTRTAGSVDQNTRTMLVEIQVDNRSGKLLPGMYAVATFPVVQGAGPLVVSGDAIAIRGDRPTVAVIADGKVKLTPVTIGRDLGSEVEIVGGLKEGDLIATTFTDDVRDGATVTTRMNKQQASPPPPPIKPAPPGGQTQYGDPGVTDQDMQGQNAKPQQKQQGQGARKAAGKQGSQQ